MTTTSSPDPQPAAPAPTGGVVAYLSLDRSLEAAEFYARALGAKVLHSVPPDQQGRTMHVHLLINGTSVMLSDCYPEHGHPYQPAQGFHLLLPVDDIDAWWQRAVEAGATIVMPIADMFWGDRYGQIRDPYGVIWAMSQPIR